MRHGKLDLLEPGVVDGCQSRKSVVKAGERTCGSSILARLFPPWREGDDRTQHASTGWGIAFEVWRTGLQIAKKPETRIFNPLQFSILCDLQSSIPKNLRI